MLWNNRPSLIVVVTDSAKKIISKKFKEIEKYKEELLYTIAHISKTPLNSIINMSDVLLYNFTKCED